MKPDWCSEENWRRARSCIEAREFVEFPPPNTCARIARALTEAEQRGREMGRREAAASRLLNRIEWSAPGELDEVCTDGGAHLERMSKNTWWLSCERSDGSSFAVWFKGKVTLTEEREPPAIRSQGGQ